MSKEINYQEEIKSGENRNCTRNLACTYLDLKYIFQKFAHTKINTLTHYYYLKKNIKI